MYFYNVPLRVWVHLLREENNSFGSEAENNNTKEHSNGHIKHVPQAITTKTDTNFRSMQGYGPLAFSVQCYVVSWKGGLVVL